MAISTLPHDAALCNPFQDLNWTDLGNARRFLIAHGPDLHFCHPLQRWFVWDGARWKEDFTGEVVARAKDTVRAMYAEAASEEDDKRRKDLARHALRSEAAQKIRAMVELLKTEPGIPVLPEELDRDPWLLNCENGTLDLRTGELREHRREDLLTKVIPVSYDPNATCPQWYAFLDRIMAGRADLVTFLQRAVGYSLTGLTDERVLFILHGCGANGKSSFLETIALLLGDYAMRTTTDTLLARQQDGVPNDIARLRGARFVYASEAEEGRRLAEAKIKDLTGGDTITARFMRAEWFQFKPEFKLFMGSNHKPVVRGTDAAIWDRIRLIPFDVRIPEPERIPRRELMARFQAELPGILAWSVRGCLDWQAHGLGIPQEVAQATGAYRAEMDVLAQFLEECCIVNPLAKAKAGDLYKAYAEWCEENGERPVSQRNFGMRLTERGFEPYRAGARRDRFWRGVGLTDTTDTTDAISGLTTRDTETRELYGKVRPLAPVTSAGDGPNNGKEAFEA
ncbi:MAG: phage/plasmid primase, P4 family [Bacillota bacterium]|nr:phage/plasmid primase, P4 family [Bacillota bacterium]